VESPTHNVGRWLERHAATAGDRRAIVDAERDLDYAALCDRTRRCAAVLRDAGVERGDRVAILLGNRSAYIEAVFATARLGAIAVPVNARFTPPEIQRILEDCKPRILIHESGLAKLAKSAAELSQLSRMRRIACGGEGDPYEAALEAARPLCDLEPVSPEDPMLLLYTSGTTGVPKGALLPHRKTLFNSLNAQLYFELTRSDRTLVPLPLFHSFGLLILALPTLYTGGSVHLMPRFDPDEVWKIVDRERITLLGGVPTMFQSLLEALGREPAARLKRDSLRFMFTAGAAVSTELVLAFEKRNLVLKQGYGQTETSILCCLDARDAIRKAGSVGRPVFHVELRVIDPETLSNPIEQWRDVAVGETGEITARGPIIFLGYWNLPEATAETLRGDWVRTGDLATVDAEGFVTLVARAREMYISGGENVYPAEIENAFAEHPAIREVAVTGIPDAKWGETGRAYVVPAEGSALDTEALLGWASERLARFKLPSEFVVVDTLPRTASGKVQKHRLPEINSR
jgi:fatty-acyl-CoA synthase